MSSPGSHTALLQMERLALTDPASCATEGELADVVHHVQGVRAWLDAYDGRCARRAAALARSGLGAPAAELLTDGGRRPARTAVVAVARSEVCAAMPGFEQALEAGVVSAAYVDAVARAAASLPETKRAELLELGPALVSSAVMRSVEAFERDCRDLVRLLDRADGESRIESLRRQRRVRRWGDPRSGMHHTLLSVDPETDARVHAALHEATRHLRSGLTDREVDWDHVQADALVALITGAQALDPRSPEISVLVDLETLEHGLHERSVCETPGGVPLTPAAVRRLACDAAVLPVVLGGDGEALDVGRSRRLATAAQRRAIEAMHATCVLPRCAVPVDECRIHHVEPWSAGGSTDLSSLVPVCERDHHRLHEGGWELKVRPDRRITLIRPDGTVAYDGPSVDRRRKPPDPPAPPPDPPEPSAASPGPLRRPPRSVDST